MSLPSDSVSPSELFLALTKVPRPSRVVDFPRRDANGKPLGELRIMILSQEQQMEASGEAERYTRKVLKDAPKSDEARRGYDDVYSNAAACEVLFKACRDANDVTKPLFQTVQDIRKWLTADEVGLLMTHYFTAQAELGPLIASMSEGEVDAWVLRIREAGTLFPLDLLTSDMLKSLVATLASRLATFLMANTSSGLPPEESATSEVETPETLAPSPT